MEIVKKTQCREYIKFYLLYTVVFACTAALVFLPFIKAGKSFLWANDGLKQHYLSLVYYGEYLREIAYNLFVAHKFQIPMWDMNIGYGSDILTTLHYYVFGDPLSLLSIFVPAEKTEYLYGALVVVRIYLAGIAFSAYAFSHKKSKSATVVGMLLYCFSGFALYAGVRHPFFTNPMIYLPILLIGIDQIFKKKKPYLFIASVAVSALSNFYFFYMLCIFMLLYAIFRYFMVEKSFKLTLVLTWFLKFVAFFAIGVMLAAPIFVPVVLKVLAAQRLGVENNIPVLFPLAYYGEALYGFVGYLPPSSWNAMGYTPVAMFSVFVLWMKKKKYPELKLGFLLLSVFLCIPFIGHVFNGFSYVAVRWVWGYSMLIAYIVTCVFPYLPKLVKWEKTLAAAGMFFWLCASGVVVGIAAKRGLKTILPIAVCTFILSVILMAWCLIPHRKHKIFQLGIIIITIGGIFLNGISCYQWDFTGDGNYVNEFWDVGTGWTMALETPSNSIKESDGEFYRYDQYRTDEIQNISMIQKKCGTKFYFSISDSYISAFMREMCFNSSNDYNYNNQDGRSVLEALASVRYFVIRDGEEGYLPYGYTKQNGNTVIDGVKYTSYENENVLPIGVTFNKFIPRQKYEEMNVLQKQEALLQAVVVEEADVEKSNPDFSHKEVPYTMTCGKGVTQKQENTFKVTKKNAKITLNFQGLEESETYLLLQGLHYKGDGTMFNIRVTGETDVKNLLYRTQSERSYCGIHDFLCNVGYRKEAQNKITIAFPEKGTYTMERLQVACQPVKPLISYGAKLKEDTLEDVTFGINSMEGRIKLEEPKILFLTIPYSKGFRAYVDGEEWEIKQADTMYMALELESGEHQIELTYTTPYLKTGIVLMVLGILCVAGLLITKGTWD